MLIVATLPGARGAAGQTPGAPPSLAPPHQHAVITADGRELRVTADERELRGLLARYADGDVADVVAAIVARPPSWMSAVVEAVVDRIQADLEYHLRPQNRLSVADQARIGRELRGDRLR